MQDSRGVVADQVKAEREAAIVARAIDKAFAGPGRGEPAALALAAAAVLRDESLPAESLPLVRAMAARGLELGGEVALGRVKAAEVSRAPAPRGQ